MDKIKDRLLISALILALAAGGVSAGLVSGIIFVSQYHCKSRCEDIGRLYDNYEFSNNREIICHCKNIDILKSEDGADWAENNE